MEVIKTDIDGVVIIEPKVFNDARGYFFESFSQREFEEKVRKVNFVQDNESMSSYGVMRGLHFQCPPFTQSKLVRCVKGCVLDVAVDIRNRLFSRRALRASAGFAAFWGLPPLDLLPASAAAASQSCSSGVYSPGAGRARGVPALTSRAMKWPSPP